MNAIHFFDVASGKPPMVSSSTISCKTWETFVVFIVSDYLSLQPEKIS